MIDSLPIPSGAWDASQTVHIRWFCITDSSSVGTMVNTAGVCKIDEISVLETAVNAIEKPYLAYKVYPNPCNATLNIETRVDIIWPCIMSIDGRLIQAIAEHGNSIDLSALEPGLYFLCIETDKISVTHKIIVE